MASDCSDDSPLHPDASNGSSQYGPSIQILTDPLGGPPTVYRDPPQILNWDKLSPTALNMFAELATDDSGNRFELCVQSTLEKWAQQMKRENPNFAADGDLSPFYKGEAMPIIKAYVSRIPEPGVAGTPIPPALPMVELEALDFLHQHHVLPYQQTDYAEIFGDIPDGFVWHPIQTLAGIRGLDHRTLIEFRAYKHFWAIHKDDPSTRELSTKGHPTCGVSITRAGGNPNLPEGTIGGFHNMSLHPSDQQLRREFARINRIRKYNGESAYPQAMYVRFTDNLARIVVDHCNDTSIFDSNGVPLPKVIGSLQNEDHIDQEEFASRFMDYTRLHVNPLKPRPDNKKPEQTQKQAAATKKAAPNAPVTSGNTKSKANPNVIEFTAEFAGTGLEARIDVPTCECPSEVKAASMSGALASGIALMKKSLSGGTQRVHIPEVDCCAKTVAKLAHPTSITVSTPAPSNSTKAQLDAANLSAIESKIKQLSLEKNNPRQLKPLSKNTAGGYSFDYTASTAKAVATKIATAVSAKVANAKEVATQALAKGAENSKPGTSATPAPSTIRQHPPDTMLPELREMAIANGYYFANCTNRQKLVDDLANQKVGIDIPKTGPGAKSWNTLKSEHLNNPIKFRGMDGPSIEHIKFTGVISIQQTVFYYLCIGERIKKKRITADSADGTCFIKVWNILEAGQRLVVEHDIENYYVRTNGLARRYDHSMNGGHEAKPTGPLSTKYELTPDEQAAYRRLMVESKEFWKHSTTCKCRRGKP
ncbi:hypothetical protein TWF481_008438 [Arthrobotrys musiformis]|uniref:ASX DEUBAD domain-containing protein n=1 Tax=Arthrobotrys musiformis TaxID=47236 RepID=A0AAV9W752_9PEZI